MPSLVDLLNNLSNFNYYTGRGNFTQNNLPFGPDRANSGKSKQPYIEKTNYKSDPTGLSNVVSHAATDTIRMTKFLADVPRGPLFLAKQIGQQLMNPELQHKSDLKTDKPTKGQGFFTNTSNFVSNTTNFLQNKLGSNRIYSPLNFIAQIAGSGVGAHIPRQGFSLNVNYTDKYPYVVAQNEKNGENRLVNYMKVLSVAGRGGEDKVLMHKYTGGPNSSLGIGSTSIYSYYSTFAAGDASIPDSLKSMNGFIPMLKEVFDSLGAGGYDMSYRDQDFREIKYQSDPAYKKTADKSSTNINGDVLNNRAPKRISNYKKYNTTSRIGIINPNNKSFIEQNYDVVNMVAPYFSKEPVGAIEDINSNPVSKDRIRDIIKFRIKVMDNDRAGYGTYLIFRAFLDGVFSNSIERQDNAVKYIGRGETFYAYEGFTESYSISFTIAAMSSQEMKPLYQKLNYLKSSFAPDYKNNKMRGNFVEMTVGDYLKYQPGIITSMTIGVPEDAPWEIAMNEPDETTGENPDAQMHELPQVLKVQLSFTPIYNFLPRKSSEAPFIGIDKTEANGKNDWISGTNIKLK